MDLDDDDHLNTVTVTTVTVANEPHTVLSVSYFSQDPEFAGEELRLREVT